MSYTSIFQSVVSEQRWVNTINNTLAKQIAIDIPPPPVSIFRVPKSLVDTKPEAYIPERIGLGPYHHLRPEMHRMMRYKIAAAKRLLTQEQNDNIQLLVVNKLKDIDPYIRACYDEYLDIDTDTLAWMLAIDGLYLLSRLSLSKKALRSQASMKQLAAASTSQADATKGTSNEIKDDQTPMNAMWSQSQVQAPNKDQGEIEIKGDDDDDEEEEEDKVEKISWSNLVKVPEDVILHPRDIVKLENQIPLIVLKEIENAIHVSRKADQSLDEMLQTFCEEQSPLQLLPRVKFRSDIFTVGPAHLLDFMYRLVVCNVKPKMKAKNKYPYRERPPDGKFEGFSTFLNNMVQTVTLACSDNLPKPFLLMKKLFLIGVPFLNKGDTGTEKSANQVEEIDIPSASHLHDVAKVIFKLTPGGIREIKYDEETLVFYLPVITLKENSEEIIRNLTAYEQAITRPGSSLELTEYIDMMCGIIDTAKDVDMLKKEGIIQGELENDAIIRLFNGIGRYKGGHSGERTNLRRAIWLLRKRFNSRPVVKAFVFAHKQALLWWKVLVTISTVVVVLLVIYQQVCSVYSCNPHIFGRSLQHPIVSELQYGSM